VTEAPTSVRRPPAPNPAERAKTIATRNGPASLMPTCERAGLDSERVVPLLHHVHHSGSVSVLLPDDHPMVGAAKETQRGELAVMAELADQAPVALREPIRGLLWITGWLRAVPMPEAREIALEVAESRADPRLLDLGYGAVMVRLSPASLVLADGEGTHPVELDEFAAAAPDPFCGQEAGWLRHLELSHTDVVGQLVRHLPDELRGGHVRPLGLDRFGLRLRVEALDADHDVRLAFTAPISTPGELAIELRRLVGCPFLAATKGA
jgi:Protein of unknown function (DUF2470)